ncbi:acyl-CoA desaturase [Nonomuraea sp. WAC 01424]|uniref:fatty acid desaturase n=1 Tax=Nonomuraea sp. WAC 01424 TaxID=2203200 RepID=UPI001C8B39B5|nr:acyl-CoA desaturase [Nonomuraea sp. WAC 01424]
MPAGRPQTALTGAIVIAPFAALGAVIYLAWGHGVAPTDLLLAAAFYVVTGPGVTVGFHRLLTHGSFTARPWLRVVLAVAGAMGFQGNVIDWVAPHRRHHAFTDRPGDPHSPYRYGTSLRGQLRGLAHAHLGWLFTDDQTSAERLRP